MAIIVYSFWRVYQCTIYFQVPNNIYTLHMHWEKKTRSCWRALRVSCLSDNEYLTSVKLTSVHTFEILTHRHISLWVSDWLKMREKCVNLTSKVHSFSNKQRTRPLPVPSQSIWLLYSNIIKLLVGNTKESGIFQPQIEVFWGYIVFPRECSLLSL